MPELKPCPFCGSEAITSWNNKFGWQAFCGNDSCFMSQIIATTFETEEQAIQSWNNRTRYDKQEPRVMTREELKQFAGSPCWFESRGTYRGKDGFWIIPAMFHTFFAGTIMYYVSVSDGIGDCGELGLPAYNRAWRCWTARPTKEQREAVKWA